MELDTTRLGAGFVPLASLDRSVWHTVLTPSPTSWGRKILSPNAFYILVACNTPTIRNNLEYSIQQRNQSKSKSQSYLTVLQICVSRTPRPTARGSKHYFVLGSRCGGFPSFSNSLHTSFVVVVFSSVVGTRREKVLVTIDGGRVGDVSGVLFGCGFPANDARFSP